MSRGTHTKAAAWVRRLDETRGSGIDAGCKGVLQCLWDHVDFDVERHATPRECWPSAETIAEQIGSTVAAVRDRLGKLTRAGWVRFEGRGWALAWVAPFSVDALEPGHVYVIEFSDGTVKVGKSVTPSARIASHASTAACFGITTVQVWTSGLLDCGATERATLEYLRQTFESRNGGEFFVGGFDAAVAFVGTLGVAAPPLDRIEVES